jgi:hypothetical protein
MKREKTTTYCLAAWLLATGVSQAFPQTAERYVEVEPQHRDDAVAVTRVTLGNAVLRCGIPDSTSGPPAVSPVTAGPDWLSKIAIYLQNRTEKPILYSESMLSFPETGDGRTPQTPQSTVPMRLGSFPSAVAFLASGQPMHQPARQALNWQPGQTLVISLDAGIVSEVQRTLQTRLADPAQITRLLIRRGPVVFSDNMKWTIGGFAVPDPEKLGGWKSLSDRKFFPGHPSWPLTFKEGTTALTVQPTTR